MRRLFSTFAHGAPGLGLLLLRLAVGIALASHAVMALRSGPLVGPTVLNALTGVVGILLLAGLWTPIAGTILAILASLSASMHPSDPWNCIFLGTLGAVLALVGPGAWSVTPTCSDGSASDRSTERVNSHLLSRAFLHS